MKKRNIILIHLLLICALTLLVIKFAEEIVFAKQSVYYAFFPDPEVSDEIVNLQPASVQGNEWFLDHPLIHHAGGQINGHTYTNSQEALKNTLSNGNCFIEIDFAYTSDSQLVCVHEWEDVHTGMYYPTMDEFLAVKVQGKYTPMTAQDLIAIMKENPQMHLVTDTKEDDLVSVISDLVELAERDASILKRVIIQLYYGPEKEDILKIYPFQDSQFLLTTYKMANWPQELGNICSKYNIAVLTFSQWNISAADIDVLRQNGYTLYQFTVNRPDYAKTALKEGICSFYTDCLSPEDIK